MPVVNPVLSAAADPQGVHRAPHRDVLRHRVRFRSVVALRDANFESLIQETFRAQYLKGSCGQPLHVSCCVTAWHWRAALTLVYRTHPVPLFALFDADCVLSRHFDEEVLARLSTTVLVNQTNIVTRLLMDRSVLQDV